MIVSDNSSLSVSLLGCGGSSGSGGAAKMDIATGNVTFIENTLGWENNYGGTVSVRVEPVRFEHAELVLTDGFQIELRASWPAKLSRNKEYLALVTDNFDLTEHFLEVYTRTGELVQRRQLPGDFPFNWLPDGRIIVDAVKPDVDNPIDVDPYSDTPNNASLIKLWHKIDATIPEERWPRRHYYWQP